MSELLFLLKLIKEKKIFKKILAALAFGVNVSWRGYDKKRMFLAEGPSKHFSLICSIEDKLLKELFWVCISNDGEG